MFSWAAYNVCMPVESNHGRGATRNLTPTRFNLMERQFDGDWLDQVEAIDGAQVRRTTVTVEHPKTILTRNASPDIGFDRSVNAFRGCEHGCIYCFARPTHAYHGLSPGVDFESRLFVKPNAAALLQQELARPGYEVAPIAMGTNTDPYQPIEEQWRVTRSVVELLLECRHPFTVTHQVRPCASRSRPARAGWSARHLLHCDFGDIARPEDRPHTRAEGACAEEKAGGGEGAERGGGAMPCRDRAGGSADHRP